MNWNAIYMCKINVMNTMADKYFMLHTVNYLSNITSQRDLRREFVCFKANLGEFKR